MNFLRRRLIMSAVRPTEAPQVYVTYNKESKEITIQSASGYSFKVNALDDMTKGKMEHISNVFQEIFNSGDATKISETITYLKGVAGDNISKKENKNYVYTLVYSEKNGLGQFEFFRKNRDKKEEAKSKFKVTTGKTSEAGEAALKVRLLSPEEPVAPPIPPPTAENVQKKSLEVDEIMKDLKDWDEKALAGEKGKPVEKSALDSLSKLEARLKEIDDWSKTVPKELDSKNLFSGKISLALTSVGSCKQTLNLLAAKAEAAAKADVVNREWFVGNGIIKGKKVLEKLKEDINEVSEANKLKLFEFHKELSKIKDQLNDVWPPELEFLERVLEKTKFKKLEDDYGTLNNEYENFQDLLLRKARALDVELSS